MNARWVKLPAQAGMIGSGQAGAENWVACDDDDEVIASVCTNSAGGIAYANISVPLQAAQIYSATIQPSRQFLTVFAAQAWVQRQLANTYSFPAPTTGWATTVAPLGGTP